MDAYIPILAALIGVAGAVAGVAYQRARDRKNTLRNADQTLDRRADATIVIEGLGDIVSELRTDIARVRAQALEDIERTRQDCERRLEAEVSPLKSRIAELGEAVKALRLQIKGGTA